MAKDRVYRITRWAVLKVKCTPPFEEMNDEKEFFEDIQNIGCWYSKVKKDTEGRVYIFAPKSNLETTLNTILGLLKKQKVEPVVESTGKGTTVFDNSLWIGNPLMSVIVEIDSKTISLR
jgi:predicted transport protein